MYGIGGKALLNQHIFKVVFDKVEINKRYFVYAVQFKLKEMEAKAHGATMKHIVKKDFDSTLIPYPSLKEQSRIAETIDSIAKSINMRQKQLQKLDDLIKARFVELFASVEAEDTLQNLCTFIDYRGKTPEKVESGLPFITAKNIRMHRMSFDTLEYISKETYDRVYDARIPANWRCSIYNRSAIRKCVQNPIHRNGILYRTAYYYDANRAAGTGLFGVCTFFR